MKVSKMFVVVAMMVASTGLQAHATASSSIVLLKRLVKIEPLKTLLFL